MEEIENLLKLIPKNLSYTEAEEWAQKIFQTYCADVHGSDIAFRLLVVDLLKYSANVELGERNANDFKTGAGSFGVDQATEFKATVGGFVLDQTREILRTLQTVDVSGLTKQYKGFKETAEEIRHVNFWRGVRHIGFMAGVGIVIGFGLWLWYFVQIRSMDKKCESTRVELAAFEEKRDALQYLDVGVTWVAGNPDWFRLRLPSDAVIVDFSELSNTVGQKSLVFQSPKAARKSKLVPKQ